MMRKTLYIALPLLLFILNTSCEEKTSQKEEQIVAENDNQIESEEDKADSVLAKDYNNFIMEQVIAADVALAKLEDFDAKDVTTAEMNAAVEEAFGVANIAKNNLASTTPLGTGSTEFKNVALEYLEAAKNLMTVYSEFADQLSIPDDEWSDEEYDKWSNLAEPVFGDYQEAGIKFSKVQDNFGKQNNFSFEAEPVNHYDIYEEQTL